ncbi:unnamed protein product [Ectocarpus sp. CCAP 1310/34]|nr:unnamed protein product [Ectocarpus sp. CCAP 1310/34]
MTSVLASTKLNNVKFWVREGNFSCSVPMLDWTSVETSPFINIDQVAGGAAMRIEPGSTATFAEDVTFSACELPVFGGGSDGAAIANLGTLSFQGTATFKDTPDGGALYTWGDLTFEKDAIFENNKSIDGGDGNGSGAGLYSELDGEVLFMGAAYFIDNEVYEMIDSGGRGAAYYCDLPTVFKGPVVVRGNSGMEGALYLNGKVTFEDLVTVEDNIMEPKLYGDRSEGAIRLGSYSKVDFQAGITATGNIAKDGGALYVDAEAKVTISGPVTITGNEARSSGGAIWMGGESLKLPADADISDNTAVSCPGIEFTDGEVVFDGGETYTSASTELCYFGTSIDGSTPTDLVEEFNCEAYSETAPTSNDLPILVIDTQEIKSWDFGSGGGFSCPTQMIVYVTGGGELTVTSSAASTTIDNARFEVSGFSKLILDVPGLTMTGIYQSQAGGALFVDVGSSMEVMHDITFLGNTVAINYELGLWEARGGAAVYSAGTTTFYGTADFLGNGQYDADANGYEPSNEDGGAVYNSGSMTFARKGTFLDNFNPNGGNGGAVANFGDLTFNVRGVFKNNSVGVAYTDDGDPYGGRGGAVYNGGDDSTVLFGGLVIFSDNVGGTAGAAVASKGSDPDDDDASGVDSKVTFEDKAKFKDNYIIPPRRPTSSSEYVVDEDKGGGALAALGITRIDFQDTAVFKRNEAIKGGAILNSGSISFLSEAKLVTADNVASSACADILNDDSGVVNIGTTTFLGSSDSLCERTAV